jgi:hypothetical protein
MDFRRNWHTAGIVIAAQIFGGGLAFAGGASLDDDAPEGVPYFGFVKDAGGNKVPDAKVSAEFQKGGATLITRSDATGHYTISAFGDDINPDEVKITCSKEGFVFDAVIRREVNLKPGDPVEADCMVKKQ